MASAKDSMQVISRPIGGNQMIQNGMSQIYSMSQQNNAWSAQQAQKQMDFQRESNRIAMDYNTKEASKNRDWQQYMSNTAHQREIKDLKAAGLNPVLSAMGGNGAAVGSGATAAAAQGAPGAKGDTDQSGNMAITNLLGSMLDSATSLENQRVSAEANLAVADKYNAMSQYVAELQSATQLSQANISAAAQKYVAGLNLAGTKYASDSSRLASIVSSSISAAAQKYGHDLSSMTQKEIAELNREVQQDMQKAGFQHEFDIKTMFPSSPFQVPGAVAGQLGDLFGNLGSWLNSAPKTSAKDQGRGVGK